MSHPLLFFIYSHSLNPFSDAHIHIGITSSSPRMDRPAVVTPLPTAINLPTALQLRVGPCEPSRTMLGLWLAWSSCAGDRSLLSSRVQCPCHVQHFSAFFPTFWLSHSFHPVSCLGEGLDTDSPLRVECLRHSVSSFCLDLQRAWVTFRPHSGPSVVGLSPLRNLRQNALPHFSQTGPDLKAISVNREPDTVKVTWEPNPFAPEQDGLTHLNAKFTIYYSLCFLDYYKLPDDHRLVRRESCFSSHLHWFLSLNFFWNAGELWGLNWRA